MTSRRLALVLQMTGAVSTVAFPFAAIAAGARWPVAIPVLLGFAFFAAGTYAVRRVPDNPAAVGMLLIGALHMLAFALSPVAVLVDPGRGAGLLVGIGQVAYAAGFVGWLRLTATFPDGDFERRSERAAVRGAAVVLPVLATLGALGRSEVPLGLTSRTPPVVRTPVHVGALAPVADLTGMATTLALLAGLVFVVLRYRRASGTRKLAMRWPAVSAIVIAAAAVSAPLVGRVLPGVAVAAMFVAAAVSLPVTFMLALVRLGNLRVNVVLRRTVTYALLWVAITGVYAAVTGALGLAAGGRASADVAVATTLVAALLFEPARRRLERLADRWLFGDRLSGYEALRALGDTFERSYGIEDVLPQLVTALRRGVQAQWARVCLVDDTGTRPAAADRIELGGAAQPVLVLPVSHGGTQLGTIEAGPKERGQYLDDDIDLARTFAQQAGLAVKNAALASDLARRLEQVDEQARELIASRARIVQAEEAERRRIERNIHDGVQQQLVALMAKLELARTRLGASEDGAALALADAQQAARHTLADLRDLATGIYPAVLADQGLVEAVATLAARLPLEVTIDTAPSVRKARFPAEMEGCAYFLVSEALANAMKHAAARHVGIAITRSGSDLAVRVTDDGRGFDLSAARLRGIEGLRDRIEAVGGSFDLHSAPGEGTHIAATLPTRATTDA